ncbi:hydroxyacylglutathione hydrolase (plasmid) [Variovorax sp. SRS16]|uniref:MBL fold metallo-hydrolase n=1 Tax=Variovorax sp. SRS16 TaxID=282217 RepID=UPI001316BDCB|nr:MBL fold metallo-hydrolase [Variovorax sp. SRS16]VTU45524.1 hydroxyacylglutathione hydrolase [Variovorax sp. SRS16]
MDLHAERIECAMPDGPPVSGMRLGPVEVFLGAQSGKFPDGNQVIVRGSDAMAVFDTPMVANRIATRLADADLVILGHVHEDHAAGLHLLPHVPLHVPRADVDAIRSLDGLRRHYGYSPGVVDAMVERARTDFHFVPRPDALAYDDGATWELGGLRVRAIHMPGHTAGHSVLLIEPLGIAFIGDIDLSSFGPYYGDACSDLGAFRRTLTRMLDLPARAWITSHHKGIVMERAGFSAQLERFAAVIERRDEALLAALREQPATLEELAARRFVYPPSFNDLFVPDVERRVALQHLEALIGSGRVERRGAHYAAMA